MAHCVHHLLTALPQPLLPFIRTEFGLSYTRSAFVVSAFTLANAFAQVPAGWLADRIGTRVLITVGILGVAIAGVFVGLSRTYIMLIAFLMLMGLVGGGYHPAATPMISTAVEPNQRGRALGFHLIGGNAAFFLTPVIAAAIAGANIWDLGWRGAVLALAIPTAIFGIFFYLYVSKLPGMSQGSAAERRKAEELMPTTGNVRRLVSFLIMNVVGGGFGMSMMSLLPLYVVDRFSVSEQTAASILSIAWSAGLWAGPVGGYISDRIGRVPVIVVGGLLNGIFVYMLNFAPWGIAFGAVLLFMGISSTMRMPVAEAFILDQTPAKHRSMIYGVYYFTMGGSGAVFAPILGYIIDEWGFKPCFTIAAVGVFGVTLVCAPFLRGGQS